MGLLYLAGGTLVSNAPYRCTAVRVPRLVDVPGTSPQTHLSCSGSFLPDRVLKVTVLLFAAHRDLVGVSEVDVELSEGAKTVDLLSTLRSRGGAWATLPSTAALAVNQRYADEDTILKAGDEVALIPPVSGG